MKTLYLLLTLLLTLGGLEAKSFSVEVRSPQGPVANQEVDFFIFDGNQNQESITRKTNSQGRALFLTSSLPLRFESTPPPFQAMRSRFETFSYFWSLWKKAFVWISNGLSSTQHRPRLFRAFVSLFLQTDLIFNYSRVFPKIEQALRGMTSWSQHLFFQVSLGLG